MILHASLLALVVAAVVVTAVAVVLLRTEGKGRRRKKALRIAAIVGLSAVVVALGVAGLERLGYRQARGHHLAHLAAAVTVYWQQNGAMAERLEDIRATGLYGSHAYRAPADGWEQTCSGPPPVYLPVTATADCAGCIVALEGMGPRTPEERGYVVVGDTSWHRADADELAALLAADNARRSRLGESRLWDVEAVRREMARGE